MLKEKSNPWARAKYLYVLPLAALAVTAFARPEVSAVTDEISNAKVNDLAEMVKTNLPESVLEAVKDTLPPGVIHVPQEVKDDLKGTHVFDVVEQMPEYSDGGMAGLMKYFKENFVFPVELNEMAPMGRVIVQFVVQKDGSISNAIVLRGVDPLIDAEAIRLVNAMPKWKPGMQGGKPVAVKYTVPVKFSLDDAADKLASGNLTLKTTPVDYSDKLILVNGKEVSPDVFEALSPDRIQSISILKDRESISQYTSDASKKAVFLIDLKKAQTTSSVEVPTVNTSSDIQKALVVIDDKIVEQAALKVLSPDRIESVTVLKDKSATDLYGEAGKNGVLYIRTKDSTAAVQNGEIKVQGVVVNKQGEPIVGACVQIVGTNKGTVTDVDGKFTIPASGDAMLEVSYVGMEVAKEKVRPLMVVTLAEE